MAQTPEKKVKDAVTKILRAWDAYYFFPATGGYGRSGVPDIIACYKGYFMGIECKAGTRQLTKLQERELERITAAGGFAFTVNEYNLDDVELILRTIESLLVSKSQQLGHHMG